MVIPISPGADEVPYKILCTVCSNLCARTPSAQSYVEKGLANCSHVFVRCGYVRKALESPLEGPLRVLARNAKICRSHRGDKGDVGGIDRVKAAVAKAPPDLPHRRKCAGPLPRGLPPPPTPCVFSPPIPLSFSFPTLVSPSRALHPPPTPQSPISTSSNPTTTTHTQSSPSVALFMPPTVGVKFTFLIDYLLIFFRLL
ncbi:hypothetical protein SprV_0301274800 [Sparganum proliferum]